MLKPKTPANMPADMPNIPGMGALTDTFEFMKNLWGGMGTAGAGVPGMVMPTLSVDEINKQIADLKAVESWLHMNMNMLRGTIQALEVQSATISALQSMGQTFGAAANANAANAASAFSFAKAAQPAPADAQPQPEPTAESKAEAKRKPGSEAQQEFKGEAQPAAHDASTSASQSDPAHLVAPLANPAVWWNMLQDQFKQAVNAATASGAAQPDAPPASTAARKRKPRSKT